MPEGRARTEEILVIVCSIRDVRVLSFDNLLKKREF
jgi:hypothetical protein